MPPGRVRSICAAHIDLLRFAIAALLAEIRQERLVCVLSCLPEKVETDDNAELRPVRASLCASVAPVNDPPPHRGLHGQSEPRIVRCPCVFTPSVTLLDKLL